MRSPGGEGEAQLLESRGSVGLCPSVRFLQVDGQVSPAVPLRNSRWLSGESRFEQRLQPGRLGEGRRLRIEGGEVREKGCRDGTLGNVLWLPGRGRLAKGPWTSPFHHPSVLAAHGPHRVCVIMVH